MLTTTERDFVIEIIKDLKVYADDFGADYSEEAEQAIEILEKLQPTTLENKND